MNFTNHIYLSIVYSYRLLKGCIDRIESQASYQNFGISHRITMIIIIKSLGIPPLNLIKLSLDQHSNTMKTSIQAPFSIQDGAPFVMIVAL